MISFDDYGGSGGNVDLSPIYLSLGVLKSNTQMIWDSLTNGTGTITLSSPYLETYRTENEAYMYNISGDLPSFSGNKYINGFYTISNQSFNNDLINLNYVNDCGYATFAGKSINISGSTFCSDVFSSCDYVNLMANILNGNIFSQINYVNVSAYSLNSSATSIYNINSFESCTNINVSFNSGTFINFNKNFCINVSGIYGKFLYANSNVNFKLNLNSLDTFGIHSADILNMTCWVMTSGLFDWIGIANISGYFMSIPTFKNNININLTGLQLSKASIESNNFMNITCGDIIENTISSCSNISIYCNRLLNGSLGDISNLTLNCNLLNLMNLKTIGAISGSIYSLQANTLSSCSVNLTGEVLSGISFNDVKGLLSFKTITNCTFNEISNLKVYCTLCQNLTVSSGEKLTYEFISAGYMNFDKLSSLSIKNNDLMGAARFTSCSDLTLNVPLNKTNGIGRDYRLSEDAGWLGKLVLKRVPFELPYTISSISEYGVRYTNSNNLYFLEGNAY